MLASHRYIKEGGSEEERKRRDFLLFLCQSGYNSSDRQRPFNICF